MNDVTYFQRHTEPPVSVPFESGIDPTARIAPTARIDPTARVAARVEIGPGVVVGPDADIREGAVIGAGTTVGYRVLVDRDVRIGEDVELPEGLRVLRGAVVGSGCRLVGRPSAGGRLAPELPEAVELSLGDVDARPGVVGAGARLGRWVCMTGPAYVAGLADVGDNVVLGEGSATMHAVKLGPGTEVGDFAFVGARTEVGRACRLGDRSRLGPACVLADGTAVGADRELPARQALDARNSGGFAFPGQRRGVEPPALTAPSGGVHPEADVHRTAVVALGATVERGAVVGAGTVVRTGAVVRERAAVGAGVFVGEGAEVGRGARLEDDVVLGRGAVVGESTTIGRQAVIVGADSDSELAPTVVGPRNRVGPLCLFDPGVVTAVDVGIGVGTALGPGVKVADGAALGDYCRLGRAAVVGSGADVGRYSVVAGGAVLSPAVQLGPHCEVRSRAPVEEGAVVPSNTRLVPVYPRHEPDPGEFDTAGELATHRASRLLRAAAAAVRGDLAGPALRPPDPDRMAFGGGTADSDPVRTGSAAHGRAADADRAPAERSQER